MYYTSLPPVTLSLKSLPSKVPGTVGLKIACSVRAVPGSKMPLHLLQTLLKHLKKVPGSLAQQVQPGALQIRLHALSRVLAVPLSITVAGEYTRLQMTHGEGHKHTPNPAAKDCATYASLANTRCLVQSMLSAKGRPSPLDLSRMPILHRKTKLPTDEQEIASVSANILPEMLSMPPVHAHLRSIPRMICRSPGPVHGGSQKACTDAKTEKCL